MLLSVQFSERKTNLRTPLQVEVISYKKEIGRSSFKYRGGVLWISVNNNLKSQENITTFKTKIKEYKRNVNQHSFEKEACIINNFFFFLNSSL